MKKVSVLFVLLVFLVFALGLVACGGGGGGSSSTGGTTGGTTGGATLKGNEQATAGSTVGAAQLISSMGGSLAGMASGFASTAGRETSGRSVYQWAVAAMLERHVNKSMPSVSCPSGGSISGDVSSNSVQINFSNCSMEGATINGDLSATISGPASAPTGIEITSNSLTMSAAGSSFSMTNFSIVATNLNMSGDTLTGASMKVNGTMGGTEGGKVLSVVCENLIIDISSSGGYQYASMSGKMKPACLDGWITISTVSPFKYSGTVDAGGCPVGGDIKCTSGSDTIELVVASNKAITVSLNGSVVKTYANCDESEGVCGTK